MSADTVMGHASTHALALAGADLATAAPFVCRVEACREVVVVLPRTRDPGREVDLLRCRADGVPVVLRPSGGGAVVLAPGVVAASVVAARTDPAELADGAFRRFGAAVAAALARCGVGGVVQRGVSDLCLGERKIAGSSLRLWRDRILYQLSLLVDLDVGLLERYLPLPSRQPDYRHGRGHAEFVTTLRAAGHPLAPSPLIAALEEELTAVGLRTPSPNV